MKASEEKISYAEAYGISVRTIGPTTNPFLDSDGKINLSREASETANALKASGYVFVRGYEAAGKDFETFGKVAFEAPYFSKTIALYSRRGERGAILVYPSGKTAIVSSKSYKPEVSEFRK